MDLATRLQYLLEVVEFGSFSKAAEKRNIDRSVLSKQIKKLEEDLGVRLLNRSTRSVSATNAGNEVLKQAYQVRDILDQTKIVAQSYHEQPKGKLRITCVKQLGFIYVQQAIDKFLDKFPDVEIELRLDDRNVDLIAERYDIGFRIGFPKDSNLIAKKLATNHMAILTSKCFVEKYGMPETPEQLVQLPSISYSNDHLDPSTKARVNSLIVEDQKGNVVNALRKSRYKVNDASLLIKSLQRGYGYTVMPLFSLERPIKEDNLVPLLTNYKLEPFGDVYAAYPHRNPSNLTRLFIDEVQKVIGTPPVWESYIEGYSGFYK